MQNPFPYPHTVQRPVQYIPSVSAEQYSYAQAQYPQVSQQPTFALDRDRISQGHTGYNAVLLQQEQEQPRAVEEQQEQVITLTVPDGAVAGTKLQYSAPDGQELRLTVPEGVPAGSVMTLTQDPVTKQWQCMAEPSDVPSGPASYMQEHLHPAQPPSLASERVSAYYSQPPPVAIAYPNQGPAMFPHPMPQVMPFPRPVNLSYVPPPAPAVASATPVPQQFIAQQANPTQFNPPRQQNVFYHPQMLPQQMPYAPPVLMEQRPSYVPPPMLMEQRPSYVPAPQALTHQPTFHQPPSYIPPPIQMMPTQKNPSYIPPVAALQAPSSNMLPPGQSQQPLLPPGYSQQPFQQVNGFPSQPSAGNQMFGPLPPLVASPLQPIAVPQFGFGLPNLGQQQPGHGTAQMFQLPPHMHQQHFALPTPNLFAQPSGFSPGSPFTHASTQPYGQQQGQVSAGPNSNSGQIHQPTLQQQQSLPGIYAAPKVANGPSPGYTGPASQ
jgi:hypothetical protein